MGVVAKSAIREHLNKRFMDHRKLKKKSRDALMAAVQSYCKGRPYLFKTPPMKHQLVGMLLILKLKRFLLFFDMGLGKSKTVLDSVALFIKIGKLHKVLAVVENEVSVDEFCEQIAEHTNLRYCQLSGSRDKRWATFNDNYEECDIFIIHYAGLQSMLTTMGKKKASRANKKKVAGRNINQSLRKKFASKFDGLLLDESQNVSNRNTLAFRMCRAVAKFCNVRVATTGTPIGAKPEGYWSQFYLIDEGETLGPTLEFFRNCFYRDKTNKYTGFTEWEFDPSKKKILNKVVQNRSLFYEDIEVQDLPKRIDTKVPIQMSEEALVYYNMVKSGLIKSRGDYQKVKNGYLRLCQIASGYLTWSDPENPDSSIDVTFENNKIEWLRTFVPKVMSRPKRKMVIFHHFIHSGRQIEALLDELGINYASLRGEIKDKSAQKKKFKYDARCRVLVGNDRAASTSLNLQIANVGVLYELPKGLIKFKQLLKRMHRTGQMNKVLMYYLLTKDSIEEKQYKNLLAGRDLFDEVVKGNIKGLF